MHEKGANATAADPYAAEEIAQLVEAAGVNKGRMPALTTMILAMLGGAFIAFGAMSYTIVLTGSTLGFGPTRLLAGIAFSLGLVLVIVAGAELFTGNALIVMAWASRRISLGALIRNWSLVFIGNFVGALGAVALAYLSGIYELDHGAVAQTAHAIATTKLSLSAAQAFFRGVLCNALVCLAVWLCFAARDVAGKILAIVWPISAFVALGFEHSVANMYLIPISMLLGGTVDPTPLVRNLFWVSAGNVVGGGGGVALVYWAVYLLPNRANAWSSIAHRTDSTLSLGPHLANTSREPNGAQPAESAVGSPVVAPRRDGSQVRGVGSTNKQGSAARTAEPTVCHFGLRLWLR